MAGYLIHNGCCHAFMCFFVCTFPGHFPQYHIDCNVNLIYKCVLLYIIDKIHSEEQTFPIISFICCMQCTKYSFKHSPIIQCRAVCVYETHIFRYMTPSACQSSLLYLSLQSQNIECHIDKSQKVARSCWGTQSALVDLNLSFWSW